MLADRLRQALSDANVSQSALARSIGVSQGTINHILAGTTAKSKHVWDIARALGVNVAWLLGESDDPSIPGGALGENSSAAMIQELDIGYAMGAGTFVPDSPEISWRVFDSRWLDEITRSAPELLFVARGIGDSMMPTLLDNDTLIIDRGKRRIDQQDRIWAIAYGELGMIKRVRKQPSGKFLIISDNPAVSDFEAIEDELHVIGRLVWIGRKT